MPTLSYYGYMCIVRQSTEVVFYQGLNLGNLGNRNLVEQGYMSYFQEK